MTVGQKPSLRLIAAAVLVLFAGTVVDASLSDLAAATNNSKSGTHQGNPKSKNQPRG